jgi:hypothetical protein
MRIVRMIYMGLTRLREYVRCCKDLNDIINSFRSLIDYHIYVIKTDIDNPEINEEMRDALQSYKGKFIGLNNDLKEINGDLIEASITDNRRKIREICGSLIALILDIDRANRSSVYLYACEARDDINNFIPKAKSRVSEIVLFINGK